VDLPFPGYNSDHEDQPAPARPRRAGASRPQPADPAEAILECFTGVLARMSAHEIATLRAEVVRRSGDAHEFVEIIDGHLALRSLSDQP
jgi:hypothetical protein